MENSRIVFAKFLKIVLINVVLTAMPGVAASDLTVRQSSRLTQAELSAFEANGFTKSDHSYQWAVRSEQNISLKSMQLSGFPEAITYEEYQQAQQCYLLMADTSGSMKKHWSQMQEAMTIWLDKITAPVAIYGFSDLLTGQLTEIVPFHSGKTKSELGEIVKEIKIKGKNTQLYAALDKAFDLLSGCKTGSASVVVFSDGDAEDKALSIQQVIGSAHGLGGGSTREVKIHTVGFGDAQQQGTVLKLQVLSTLSEKTFGTYFRYEEKNQHEPLVTKLINKLSPMGGLVIDPKSLPYGTEVVNLVVSLEDTAGGPYDITKSLGVTETRKLNNILVSIRDITGVSNPWVVVGVASLLLFIILFLLVFLWISGKRKKSINERLKQQEIIDLKKQNEGLKDAISSIGKKIDEIKPDDPVDKKGAPYGWLEDSAGKRYPLIKYSTTIGRAQDNDVVLPDTDNTVSRQHAILDFKKGMFVWTDRAPKYPTRINPHENSNIEISGSVQIQPGDTLLCGQTELRFIIE